jgi:hypothetical protein
MPNRSELASPTRRPYARAVAAPADAWPIIAFSTLGALMSITIAIGSLGLGAASRLIVQSFWG